MQTVLAILGVWLVWTFIGMILTTPNWFPYAVGAVLGVGVQLLLDPNVWYLGFGIAGGAALLVLISDVLLVTADAIRAGVLVRLGRRG